jgi:hypothetical protein
MSICKYCGNEFLNSKIGGHTSHCKLNPKYNKTLERSKETIQIATKYAAENKKQERKEFIKICPNCGKEFTVTGTQYEYDNGRLKTFCCRSCANKRIITDDIKEKISCTLKSKETKQYKCKVCGKLYKYQKGISTKSVCSKECRNYMNTHRNEFLTEDSLKRISEGGRKSAKAQGDSKRSKNEIYFYELCKEYFKDVLHNASIFNGWDVDIIINDIKFAILWNGKWHYEKIKQKHSVEQVQNRDKIKIDNIIKCNYMPYIIKDMGKYNKKFVHKQFDIFIDFLKNNNYMAG